MEYACAGYRATAATQHKCARTAKGSALKKIWRYFLHGRTVRKIGTVMDSGLVSSRECALVLRKSVIGRGRLFGGISYSVLLPRFSPFGSDLSGSQLASLLSAFVCLQTCTASLHGHAATTRSAAGSGVGGGLFFEFRRDSSWFDRSVSSAWFLHSLWECGREPRV